MKQSFWQSPLTRSSVPKDKVTTPETLLGYLIGPFGALLSSGIFTSYLQVYLGKALELSSAYLSILQLVSTFLIVAANLIVGQLIERTRTMAGKARPWLLLSALTLSVASVLMFIMPPSLEELERRLRDRKDTSEEQIKIRMARAEWEIEQSAWYDYVVVNQNVHDCAREILKIIEQ